MAGGRQFKLLGSASMGRVGLRDDFSWERKIIVIRFVPTTYFSDYYISETFAGY